MMAKLTQSCTMITQVRYVLSKYPLPSVRLSHSVDFCEQKDFFEVSCKSYLYSDKLSDGFHSAGRYHGAPQNHVDIDPMSANVLLKLKDWILDCKESHSHCRLEKWPSPSDASAEISSSPSHARFPSRYLELDNGVKPPRVRLINNSSSVKHK